MILLQLICSRIYASNKYKLAELSQTHPVLLFLVLTSDSTQDAIEDWLDHRDEKSMHFFKIIKKHPLDWFHDRTDIELSYLNSTLRTLTSNEKSRIKQNDLVVILVEQHEFELEQNMIFFNKYFHMTVSADELTFVSQVLDLLVVQRNLYFQLEPNIRRMVVQYFNEYSSNKKKIELKKLVKYTLAYLPSPKNCGRIIKSRDCSFEVKGNHGTYQVVLNGASCSCNCDFYLGRNKYSGQQGECSHIQTAKIFSTISCNNAHLKEYVYDIGR